MMLICRLVPKHVKKKKKIYWKYTGMHMFIYTLSDTHEAQWPIDVASLVMFLLNVYAY